MATVWGNFMAMGCRFFAFFGTLDYSSCDEVTLPAQEITPWVWVKLLSLPAVFAMMIILFFMEDYFTSLSLFKKTQQREPLTDGMDAESAAFWKKHRAEQARNAPPRAASKKDKEKEKEKPNKPGDQHQEPFRLVLVDESGGNNRYRIAPSTTMREVLEFYCQRHDASPEAIVLRYQGKKLPLSETPENLGLTDMSCIDVETDHLRMYEEYKRDAESHQQQLSKQLEVERLARHEADVKAVRLDRDIKTEQKARKDAETKVKELEAEKAALSSNVSKLERDIKTHRDARKVAETALADLKKEVEKDKDSKERKKLERAVERYKSELEAKEKEIQDLTAEKQRAAADAKDAQRMREYQSQVDQLSAKLVETTKRLDEMIKSETSAQDQLKKSRQETVTWMMKAEQLEKKALALRQELDQIKDTLSSSSSSNTANITASSVPTGNILSATSPVVSPASPAVTKHSAKHAARGSPNKARTASESNNGEDDSSTPSLSTHISSSSSSADHRQSDGDTPVTESDAVQSASDMDPAAWSGRESELIENLNRWRSKAQAFERDAKELPRYKAQVLQKHTKLMEKTTKELNHWKQRAVAFEKEVKELRQWRRANFTGGSSAQPITQSGVGNSTATHGPNGALYGSPQSNTAAPPPPTITTATPTAAINGINAAPLSASHRAVPVKKVFASPVADNELGTPNHSVAASVSSTQHHPRRSGFMPNPVDGTSLSSTTASISPNTNNTDSLHSYARFFSSTNSLSDSSLPIYPSLSVAPLTPWGTTSALPSMSPPSDPFSSLSSQQTNSLWSTEDISGSSSAYPVRSSGTSLLGADRSSSVLGGVARAAPAPYTPLVIIDDYAKRTPQATGVSALLSPSHSTSESVESFGLEPPLSFDDPTLGSDDTIPQ